MQKVLIDVFVVPEESKPPFLDRSRQVQEFLRTLPGFVEGFLHEKIDGNGRFNVVTTAVWESESAYENAKKATAEEFQKTGFNPQEMMKQLKVEVERAVYRRSPY
ncbi:MAG TPA: antibiotic biosynthesis monooxygenase [Candidatus Acidoferrum sp.]|nr:antibiotic biosynthesis monooxygenase [Candidatus Acidoferrum sp.]